MSLGQFISFEGGEGCGKSTQVRILLEKMHGLGLSTLHVREPGGTDAGERIRHLLQHDPASASLCAEAELLLFAASRAQLVREKLVPALRDGTWVIADRFMDSTTVYQGSGRNLPAQSVHFINQFAVGPCQPALTFLLDIPVPVGLARARARQGGHDRMEAEPEAFHSTVRAGYLHLAADHPERIRVLDANRTAEEIGDEIWEILTNRFHGLLHN